MTTTMKQRLARWMAAMGIAFALGTSMVLGGASGTVQAFEEEDPTATPTPTSTSNGGQPGGQGGGL
ncbi:MAG TPA: hypothetical protein VFS21_39335 [Roseiflexaceae bacterium]|nr:hypothetical protein [Roseiflexaceae bacterium]